jgi:TRIAD3 protein (E3 ubiquitin-protein ligase RNF216)
MKKYEELQYQAVVEDANMRDTSKCPKCHYIAIVEETATTFPCPQCNFKSCRECGEEAHPGIRCDQVETKTETSGRNKVEEAMTNAVIRKCPRPLCRKPFMKTDGCNKITCR